MASVPVLVAAPSIIVDYGRDIIRSEATALELLADALDGGFAQAVETICATRGRIVVSGMGKSGHVGRKIAATLSSIGIAALFVHPAEAGHGDLGMLVTGDTLLVLSNSGTTRELLMMVRHARTLGIAVLAVGSQANSPLMERADVGLRLPLVEEAGPGQLAPTTSTAMMMALGDALAMGAMRLRGWSRSTFGTLHPDGALGIRLGRVAAMMHSGSRMPLVSPGMPMRDVVVTMTACSFGIAGVIDTDGALVGVITDGDLRRHADTLMHADADTVMTRQPITIPADALAEAALALMNRHQVTAVFVTDAATGAPVGLVHIHDFLRPGLS